MRLNRRMFRFYTAHAMLWSGMIVLWIIGAIRGFGKSNKKQAVVMYGHILGGNLSAFFKYAREKDNLPYDLYYATIDKNQFEKLSKNYDSGILLATRFPDIWKIVNSSCIITSHGPAGFKLLHFLRPSIQFIDVWHGIPFRSYLPSQFKYMHFYTACFVSSDGFKKIYQELRGFNVNQIVVTGFGRHDIFQNANTVAQQVRDELQLTGFKHILLHAPTAWKNKYRSNVIPFKMQVNDFLAEMNEICKSLNAVWILRMHMNTNTQINVHKLSNVINIPQTKYQETNKLLTAVDILITDWSSIASDFCLLDKPIVYVDTPRPVYFNQTHLAMERGGIHVKNLEELKRTIVENLRTTQVKICTEQLNMKKFIHGDMLDGKACQRYDKEIRKILLKGR